MLDVFDPEVAGHQQVDQREGGDSDEAGDGEGGGIARLLETGHAPDPADDARDGGKRRHHERHHQCKMAKRVHLGDSELSDAGRQLPGEVIGMFSGWVRPSALAAWYFEGHLAMTSLASK